MNWTILGIEPTKDKKAITKAYRGKLAQVNPEDRPEEFKALRGAYEEALKLADQEEPVPVRDESPVGLWMEKVRALYDDFAARIQPQNWKELLSDEVCIALDKRPAAEDALLRFLMEDFYVPQPVWQLFDETFGLAERRAELYENYPRDFVDYGVMNGICYPAGLPYELFVPGKNAKDCDQYRRLYHLANQGARNEMAPVLEQIEALSEWHPYGQALLHRLEIENGETEKGREGYRRLAQSYPQDMTLTMGWAAQCVNSGDWAEGEKMCRHVLETQPDHWQAKWVLSQSLAKQGQLEEAKSLVFELVHAAGGDQKQVIQLMNTVRELNEELIKKNEAALREKPADAGRAVELAWSYLQNDREEDALKICQALPKDYENQFEYHQLYAKVCYACKDYEQSMEHLHAVLDIIAGLEPDGTRETERRISKLPEMLQIEGSCLLLLKRNAEAMEKFEQAVAVAPEDAEVLTKMAHLQISEHQFERAVHTSEMLTRLRPGSYHGFLLLATSLYEMGRDRDAFDAVNRAQELERGDLAVYLMRMRILLRNGVWDGVRSTLDFLHQNGITDEISTMWCEAQLVEFDEKDKEKALELYQSIGKRVEAGEYLPEAARLYFRITVLAAERKDARKTEDRAELLAILDKGLEHDANDFDCMDYKAWLLKRDNRDEEALELYHKLEAFPRQNLGVEQELAELYYRDLSRYAEKALHYYLMLIENNETADLHFYAGTCRRYLGDLNGAEKEFLREQELDPNDIDGYSGLTYVYEAMGRYEEALDQANKLIELVKVREGDQSRFYFRKVQILRRLRRPLEAAEVVDEITVKYGYDSCEQMKFDIFCQYGLWEQARLVLKAWKKSAGKRKGAVAAEIRLDIYCGQIDKARTALFRDKRMMSSRDFDDLRQQMADLDGDADQLMEYWTKRAESREENTHELMNLAQICWWSGKIEEAKTYAQQTLDKLDEILKKHLTNEALYRGRRCLMLAMVGRKEEARAELEKVRKLPLCVGCSYCSCKDADDFEAIIEEICGDYEKAMKLHCAGAKRWPDDLDFVCRERRLKRKGY